MNTVKNIFEGVSVKNGIKIGGDGKLGLFGSWCPPFTVVDNPELEKLVQSIVVNCADSYKIDRKRMDQLYGFAAGSGVPAAVIDGAKLARPDNEDKLPRAEKNDKTFVERALNANIRCAPEDDPCIVKGFLSEPGDLVELFREHAVYQRLDKADDQFKLREGEEVYEGRNPTTNRRVGALSITGSIQSSQNSWEGLNSPKSRTLPLDRGVAGLSSSGASSESKKRARPEEAAKVTEAEERGAEGMARRNKRTKAMLTHQVEDD